MSLSQLFKVTAFSLLVVGVIQAPANAEIKVTGRQGVAGYAVQYLAYDYDLHRTRWLTAAEFDSYGEAVAELEFYEFLYVRDFHKLLDIVDPPNYVFFYGSDYRIVPIYEPFPRITPIIGGLWSR